MTRKWIKIFDSYRQGLNALPDNKSILKFDELQNFCLIKRKDKIYAFIEKCPHAGAKLISASCNEDDKLVCPLHNIKFDIETGRGNGYKLETYPIEDRDDGVYVGLPKRGWF